MVGRCWRWGCGQPRELLPAVGYPPEWGPGDRRVGFGLALPRWLGVRGRWFGFALGRVLTLAVLLDLALVFDLELGVDLILGVGPALPRPLLPLFLSFPLLLFLQFLRSLPPLPRDPHPAAPATGTLPAG